MPILVVDKPLGLTSHDVVAVARRSLGTRRVGHAGTLDPLAVGVLVLLTEAATKLSPFLTSSQKEYLAWIAFGASTPTLDAEGPIDATGDPSSLTTLSIEAALQPFLEITEQRPPAFSAVKQGGVRSYQRARAGDTEERPTRPAGYSQLQLLAWAPNLDALPTRFAPQKPSPGAAGDPKNGAMLSAVAGALPIVAAPQWRPDPSGRAFSLPPALAPLPTALVHVRVQAGTYVRSLARDLGLALAVPAHLAGLVRLRAGRLGLEHAVPLDAIADAEPVPVADALALPRLSLDPDTARRVRQGQRTALVLSQRTALLDAAGELVAIAEPEGGRLKLVRVWQAGETP